MKIFTLLFCVVLSLNSLAQYSKAFTAAASISSIWSPSVAKSNYKYGAGAMARFEWFNSHQHRVHFIDAGGDAFQLVKYQNDASYYSPERHSVKEYKEIFMRIQYGWRTYFGLEGKGFYGEVAAGPVFSCTQGLGDDNTTRVRADITPGFGFTAKWLALGIQLHLIPSQTAMMMYSSAHIGVRISGK